jgi:hypothetical protein
VALLGHCSSVLLWCAGSTAAYMVKRHLGHVCPWHVRWEL